LLFEKKCIVADQITATNCFDLKITRLFKIILQIGLKSPLILYYTSETHREGAKKKAPRIPTAPQ